MGLSSEEMKEIKAWLDNQENVDKLSVLDYRLVQVYYCLYMENIAPIITKYMVQDNNGQTFLFRL